MDELSLIDHSEIMARLTLKQEASVSQASEERGPMGRWSAWLAQAGPEEPVTSGGGRPVIPWHLHSRALPGSSTEDLHTCVRVCMRVCACVRARVQ